jgi:hypothetical protein
MNNDNLQYLHGLFLYEHPKNAIYRETTNEYDSARGGWISIEKQATVIGEDEHFYVTRTVNTCEYNFTPNDTIKGNFLYGIGFHKSRLVKFVETQLEMF